MIVLDTSTAIEVLLALPLSPAVQIELERHEWQIAAPQLLTIEVLQVLRRRVLAGHTDLASAEEALGLLRDLNVRFYDQSILNDRVWELRDNLTAYDASYVALSELLEVPLVTSGARLAQAPGHQAHCLLVE